ncbi:hypothetical protein ABK040_001239 [Willaertia magna]
MVFCSLCCGLGLILLGLILKKVVSFVYIHFIYKNSVNYRGKWVLVTGATAGIGEGFVREFARRGANLILAVRNEEKANKLKQEIQNKYTGVQIKIVIIDFEKDDRSTIVTKLQEAIGNEKLAVAVNNVGVNNTDNMPFFFNEQPESDFDKLVKVNMHSVISVTRAILPEKMEERGAILNLSSYTAVYPTPVLSVYAATKSFINTLSVALKYEFPKISIYGLSPMWVKSDMTMIKKASLMKPEAVDYARATIDKIGCPLLSYGLALTWWPHDLAVSIMSLIPESILMNYAKSTLLGIKKRLAAKLNK